MRRIALASTAQVYSRGCRSLSNAQKSRSSVAEMTSSTESTKIDLQPPRGTRDFFPPDHRLKSWLHTKWRNSAMVYGFEEYDSSVVESEDLFIRKSGEEISEQLYNFKDKSGRRLCLRPEMTPTLARMVLSKGSACPKPLKWFSIPQCWRYERMTRGRRREHYQWNMDIWGVQGITAEAELLGAVVHTMKALGLTAGDVGIKINTRKLIVDLLKHCDIAVEKHAQVCVVIDKIDKMPESKLVQELQKIGVPEEKGNDLLHLVKMKRLDELSAVVGENSEGLQELRELLHLAEAYGYAEWLVFTPSVVRGLSYYTGVVFECFDRQGQLRAICGGGRYDALLDTFSDTKQRTAKSSNKVTTPAVGFGFGDAVIMELLKEKNLLPDFSSTAIAQVLVGATQQSLYHRAAATATLLRNHGISVDLVLEEKRLKALLQRADRIQSGIVVVYAIQEYENGQKVMIKDMRRRGHQTEVEEEDVAVSVTDLLSKII